MRKINDVNNSCSELVVMIVSAFTVKNVSFEGKFFFASLKPMSYVSAVIGESFTFAYLMALKRDLFSVRFS